MDSTFILLLVSTVVSTLTCLGVLVYFLRTKSEEAVVAERESRLPLATRFEDLSMKVEDLETQRDQLSAEVSEARSTIARGAQAKKWLTDNEQRYEECKKLLPDLLAQVEARQTEVAGLQEQANHVLKDSAEAEGKLKSTVAELEKCEAARLNEQEKLEAAEAALAQTKQEESKFATAVAGLKVEWDTFSTSVDKLKAEQLQLQETIAKDRVVHASLTEAVKQLSDLKTSLNSTLDDLKLAVEETQHGKQALELDYAVAEKKTQEATAQRTGAEEALAKTTKQLETAVQELREAQKNQDVVKSEYDRLKTEIESSHKLLAALREQISTASKVTGTKAGDEERLAELWSPVFKKNAYTSQRSNDETEQRALEQFGAYLQGLHLKFPRRVVNAFHTSMKVMDVSPLCVLAGISGTGKSELPRRYAEAMGMNFLNVAVQPRWDSPQDMFGFFNYLDGRYKATELARSLVQMDRYAKESGRGWVKPKRWDDDHWLGDRMLLVLLDEMNLARVEYYFSEFLSKLETRAGVRDLDVASRREKAEIALEVGISAGQLPEQVAQQSQHTGSGTSVAQAAMMRLFVDTNVLFVGTMNEDESTQSLSDKVIDRANVLRFGKPKQLLSQNGASPKAPSSSFLTYKHWLSWHKPADRLSGSASDRVNECLERLNRAMERVRRPFAFRTHRAVRTYVANYPGVIEGDEQRLNAAVADQVEFKILPKFRGLDPSDSAVSSAFNDISSVLNELGDEVLVDAIRKATQSSEHQFVWQGVDRSEEHD